MKFRRLIKLVGGEHTPVSLNPDFVVSIEAIEYGSPVASRAGLVGGSGGSFVPDACFVRRAHARCEGIVIRGSVDHVTDYLETGEGTPP